MIRYATKDDIPIFIGLSREFYNETKSYKYYGFCEKTIEFVCFVAISNNYIITDGEHGCFLFNIYPAFYDANENILTEVFWYVRNNIGEMKRGIIAYKLLKRIDEEAKSRKIRHVRISNLVNYNNYKIDNFYKKFGYYHRENSYMKEVKS